MTDISDMSLWALAVPPKKACKYEVEQTAEMVQYVHVTNVALGLGGHGDGTLTIEKDGKEIVVARLDKDRPQHNLDFILDQTVVFRNHGSLELHLLGYETVSAVMPEGEPEFGSDDDEDEDEESEEEEDEEPPRAIPISNGKVGQGPMKKAMQPQVVNDGTEDDEDEEDDEFELGADDLIMENAGDEGDEGESEDEGDEGEDEDEDEEDEDEDEEEEEPTPQPQKQAGKRPAPAAALTPQVTKKAKGADAQPKVPASAPPKQAGGKQQQQQPAGKAGAAAVKKPANEKEFEKAIIDFLKSKPDKTAPMAQLGSAVHKPDGVPKLGTWIKSRPQLFKVEDNGQKVRLAA